MRSSSRFVVPNADEPDDDPDDDDVALTYGVVVDVVVRVAFP